jgi:hypothetical protein
MVVGIGNPHYNKKNVQDRPPPAAAVIGKSLYKNFDLTNYIRDLKKFP